MTLSSTRKKLNILFATLILAFFAYALWPTLTSPIRVWLYCTTLSAGENVSKALEQAKENAFQVASPTSNRLRVYDLASLGRVGCLISTSDTGEIITTEMELND